MNRSDHQLSPIAPSRLRAAIPPCAGNGVGGKYSVW